MIDCAGTRNLESEVRLAGPSRSRQFWMTPQSKARPGLEDFHTDKIVNKSI